MKSPLLILSFVSFGWLVVCGEPAAPATPTQPEKPYSMRELDTPPVAILQDSPAYPSAARKAGLEGVVVVEFTITTTGRVSGAKIVSSTEKAFEATALTTVKRWKYKPGRIGGNAVATRVQISIPFKL